jgi:hypothetical protein
MKIQYALALICGLVLNLSGAPDVAAPSQRSNTVSFAERILKPKPVVIPSNYSNPFTLSGERTSGGDAVDQEQAAAAKAAILASNRNLLAVLADKLEPKGTFVVGGEAIILLGQKKLKVGETYSITFEGAVYELEITGIETTRFSVRYKNEELTRPIVTTKTGK